MRAPNKEHHTDTSFLAGFGSEGPTLKQLIPKGLCGRRRKFVKNCSPGEELSLEKVMKDCSLYLRIPHWNMEETRE